MVVSIETSAVSKFLLYLDQINEFLNILSTDPDELIQSQLLTPLSITAVSKKKEKKRSYIDTCEKNS